MTAAVESLSMSLVEISRSFGQHHLHCQKRADYTIIKHQLEDSWNEI
jgi:hypothetical protein